MAALTGTSPGRRSPLTWLVRPWPEVGTTGTAARYAGWLALGLVLLAPMLTIDFAAACSLGAIYAVIGLSLNVIVGYTGQLSLGHQGFLGLGALVAANVVDHYRVPLGVGLVASVAAGAAVAVVLGLVALRITGLYLSLITLVFGTAIASSLLSLDSLTGNGSGVKLVRPDLVASNGRYYFLCLLVLLVVYFFDTRLMRSKTGRALLALKENERVAEAFGIDVVVHKLIAFALSGALAGLAGGLFAFRNQAYSAQDITNPGLALALTFVVIVVVGGLGNRLGVVVAAVFFGLLDDLLHRLFFWSPAMHVLQHVPVLDGYYQPGKDASLVGLIGAVLLLQTLVFNPGGVGQSIAPVQRWLRGERFTLHEAGDSGPAAVDGSGMRA